MKVKVYTTAKDFNEKLKLNTDYSFKLKCISSESDIEIFLNPEKKFQEFMGIGGAFTDASAENFAKLPQDAQEELIQAYFDSTQGNGYRLGRTSIHSCDFSSESYTYVEDGDASLKSFSIEKDRKFRIPFIQEAIKKIEGSLTLIVSPWSAPAFMKSNKSMLTGGRLLPEYYESWAMYYAKFIYAYEAEGIPIWGLTIQNEPAAVQTWESMVYSAEEERDFLKNYLGPILKREGLGNKKIIIWDHNRDLSTHWANTIFSDEEASQYAWGLGFHWYETWAGGDSMQCNLAAIKESFPDKQLIFTEGCQEGFSLDLMHNWKHAERYGEAIIRDFNIGTVGWCDWNLLLDQSGGPNHVGNFCFSPIHADIKSGSLIYTPSYYYIGHFSRFITPGARRINSTSNRSFILTTAFLNPDEKGLICVVMNTEDSKHECNLRINGKCLKLDLPARSIQTIVLNLEDE